MMKHTSLRIGESIELSPLANGQAAGFTQNSNGTVQAKIAPPATFRLLECAQGKFAACLEFPDDNHKQISMRYDEKGNIHLSFHGKPILRIYAHRQNFAGQVGINRGEAAVNRINGEKINL